MSCIEINYIENLLVGVAACAPCWSLVLVHLSDVKCSWRYSSLLMFFARFCRHRRRSLVHSLKYTVVHKFICHYHYYYHYASNNADALRCTMSWPARAGEGGWFHVRCRCAASAGTYKWFKLKQNVYGVMLPHGPTLSLSGHV